MDLVLDEGICSLEQSDYSALTSAGEKAAGAGAVMSEACCPLWEQVMST